jgi:hypothetical protein
MIAYSVAAIFGSVERTTFTILQYLLPWAIAVVLVSAGADTGPAPASPVRESSRRKPRTLGQYQNAALPAVDSDSGAIRGKEIPGVR